MPGCPDCGAEMAEAKVSEGSAWTCDRCGVRVENAVCLRRNLGEEGYLALLAPVPFQSGVRRRPCPLCANYAAERTIPGLGTRLNLYYCQVCHAASWDGGTAQALRAVRETAVTALPVTGLDGRVFQSREAPVLTESQQERLAAFYAESVANQMAPKYGPNMEAPDTIWKKIAGFLGMPVKMGLGNKDAIPWVTWITAAMCTILTLCAFTNLRAAVMHLGFIPAQGGRYAGLTLLTGFLLHGSPIHLLGNMYYLLVFGTDVEENLGRWNYLMLLAAAMIVGALLHSILDPRTTMPLIGASGGIAGVLAFYGLAFPKNQLFFFIWFRWRKVRALVFILFWIGLQVWGAMAQIGGQNAVSNLGHLGGALMGVVFWLVWRFAPKREAEERVGPGV